MNLRALKKLFAEYASLAIYIYLIIFVVTLAGFAIAMQTGFKVDGSVGKLGVLGAAWVATKLTQPVRILASIAFTPVVARLFKIQKKSVETSDG